MKQIIPYECHVAEHSTKECVQESARQSNRFVPEGLVIMVPDRRPIPGDRSRPRAQNETVWNDVTLGISDGHDYLDVFIRLLWTLREGSFLERHATQYV